MRAALNDVAEKHVACCASALNYITMIFSLTNTSILYTYAFLTASPRGARRDKNNFVRQEALLARCACIIATLTLITKRRDNFGCNARPVPDGAVRNEKMSRFFFPPAISVLSSRPICYRVFHTTVVSPNHFCSSIF